eukprot:TRINITY_DN13074_c0_g1_i1.p1 TRINITY_DN13074_c0_g1~~TRINITY_DN13074_c0_g1_i1.p1  ORF type:complete len:120 (-),score=41.00 TRINITY_DN13074_c0_g1_i1:190-549(-)
MQWKEQILQSESESIEKIVKNIKRKFEFLSIYHEIESEMKDANSFKRCKVQLEEISPKLDKNHNENAEFIEEIETLVEISVQEDEKHLLRRSTKYFDIEEVEEDELEWFNSHLYPKSSE